MSDSYDPSIPVLKDVLMPGDPAHTRTGPQNAAEAASGTGKKSFAEPVQAFEPAEPLAPQASGSAPPASGYRSFDADVLAERLRGRFASYLAAEGRGIIESHCRDVLQDHMASLVNQITREVALALEAEMKSWVREAVDEEIARRSSAV